MLNSVTKSESTSLLYYGVTGEGDSLTHTHTHTHTPVLIRHFNWPVQNHGSYWHKCSVQL